MMHPAIRLGIAQNLAAVYYHVPLESAVSFWEQSGAAADKNRFLAQAQHVWENLLTPATAFAITKIRKKTQ